MVSSSSSCSCSCSSPFPVGFRFNPTEDELISHYLKNKILGVLFMEWENRQFVERNLYGETATPWDLMEDDKNLPWQVVVDSVNKVVHSQKILYVFTRLSNVGKNEKNNKQKNRVAGCGCWHGNSKAEAVRDEYGLGKEIGKRRTLTFHSPQETKGQWTMTEYSIDVAANGIPQWEGINYQNYVLCKIKRDDSKSSMGGRVIYRKRKAAAGMTRVTDYDDAEELISRSKKESPVVPVPVPVAAATTSYDNSSGAVVNPEAAAVDQPPEGTCPYNMGDFSGLPMLIDVDTTHVPAPPSSTSFWNNLHDQLTFDPNLCLDVDPFLAEIEAALNSS